jgi:GTP-binding protein
MNADQVQPRSTDETAADESQVADALRAGLDDFDLSDEDLALLGRDDVDDVADDEEATRPVVAIIGRPNVGKSTLVNRIIGRREAVVEDVPGVTRDRVAYDGDWSGRNFTLVDTGGWEIDATGIHLRVAEQAEVAVDLADAVLFVVDATVGATDDRRGRREAAAAQRQAGHPHRQQGRRPARRGRRRSALEPRSGPAMAGLGASRSRHRGRPRCSARRAAREVLQCPAPTSEAARAAWRSSAAPTSASPVSSTNSPGRSASSSTRWRAPRATRSTSSSRLGGKTWRFVDTAGIRRRVHQTRGADFYASLRTQTALEKAEVAVVLLDAANPLTEQDVRIISQVIEAGRGLVLAYNKWDLTDEERRYYLEREIERDLVQIPWAPRVNVSARTGRHLEKLVPAIETALDSWETRVPTGRLNAFLGEVVSAHPHPVRGGKQPRILFATQAGTRPPRFVVFASGFIEAGYRRFIERRLREEFGFEGTPIELSVRVREKRSRR